ncbi:hypothetical protein B0H14DRAFT_3785688 [Mycena olivaceomarginata]|nr:hypothetical protein B0H14DRAFT_3785688 [Mycena olivaceomarginata]
MAANYASYARHHIQQGYGAQQQQQQYWATVPLSLVPLPSNITNPQTQSPPRTHREGHHGSSFSLSTGTLNSSSLNTHASANVPKSAWPNTDLHSRLATSTANGASPNTAPPHQPQSQPQAQDHPPTALLWSELEPWMDAEYARQVCALMRWEARVCVPPPGFSVDNPNVPSTYINGPTSPYANGYNGGGYNNGEQHNGWHGRAANNGGCCVLTFGSAVAAAAALAQVNSISPPGSAPMTMPNSAHAFMLKWVSPDLAATAAASNPSAASSAPSSTPLSDNPRNVASVNANPSVNGYAHRTTGSVGGSSVGGVIRNHGGAGVTSPTSPLSPAYPLNANAFSGVGVQASNTLNGSVQGVFRNPVLGLRNDRAPKFIRPFASCKSAKIIIDPVTRMSRGFGFVRFTDDADQQRALIEMQGLPPCLSLTLKPLAVRISPATAKRPPPLDLAQLLSLPLPSAFPSGSTSTPSSINNGIPTSVSSLSLVANDRQHPGASLSVSASIADPLFQGSVGGGREAYSLGQVQAPKHSQQQQSSLALGPSQTLVGQQQLAFEGQAGGAGMEEWKQHAHANANARAILGLIGPNGEQVTSTDPYNTTVFVGGLNPLVGEETLRTFFVPFGEIHYVKVPVGKHCGFVQFVRKVDAETAILKMQGFPVGGSRIRLSWGQSQYKVVQVALQRGSAP